jgi:hypothetical protein
MFIRGLVLVVMLIAVPGCGSDNGKGACTEDRVSGAGSAAPLQECYDDTTAEACDKNSYGEDTWTFHPGKSCKDVGFPYLCVGDSIYTPSSKLCCGGSCY